MPSIKCGKCKGTHGTPAEVRACYGTPASVTPVGEAQRAQTKAATPATAAQVKYLKDLAHARPMWASVENMHDDVIERLTKADATAKINEAKAVPKEVQELPLAADGTYQAEAKRGDVHVVDGTYYRIHIAQKSGNAYAAKAIITREATWAADGTLETPGEIEWEYAKGMIRLLTAATLTTAEQASAFGKLVGRCCFCSHAIDTPESTAVGYGPVCARKYDLPWGDTTQEASVQS